MSADIVKRLRLQATVEAKKFGDVANTQIEWKAAAEIERLRDALANAVALIERLIDTRRCKVDDLRVLNAARAVLEAKP